MRTPGGLAPLVLPDGADLDEYMTPNTSYTGNGAADAGYLHCPVATNTSFTFEVLPAGGGSQIMQRLSTCSKTGPKVYERFFYSNGWGDWLCITDFLGKVLWSGAQYMTEGHTATLSEPVSAQPTGIVLVFSEYVDSEAKNWSFNREFIDKVTVAAHNGVGHCAKMCTNSFSYFATKYLYIHDDKIVGHADNNQTGTSAAGIVYTNNRFVLRYVIGV
jgi:hypothetical protein